MTPTTIFLCMSVCEKERAEGTQGVDDSQMMMMIYHLTVRNNFFFIAAITLCAPTQAVDDFEMMTMIYHINVRNNFNFLFLAANTLACLEVSNEASFSTWP